MKFGNPEYLNFIWLLIPISLLIFFRKEQMSLKIRIFFILMKGLTFGALLVALAHPHIFTGETQKGDGLVMVFLDVSESISPLSLEESLGKTRKIIHEAEKKGKNVRFYVFKEKCTLVYATGVPGENEIPTTLKQLEWRQPKHSKIKNRTNLEETVSKMADFQTPEKVSLLFSDGRPNSGANGQFLLEKARHPLVGPIFTYPMEPLYEEKGRVISLDFPRVLKIREKREIHLMVDNPFSKEVKCSLSVEGKTVGKIIPTGKSQLTFDFQVENPGTHFFDLTLFWNGGEDKYKIPIFAEKNSGVLVLSEKKIESDAMEKFFPGKVEERSFLLVEDFKKNPKLMEKYSLLVLNNVHRKNLKGELENIIHDGVYQGHFNFFCLGNSNTFGPGEFFETPLEKALPVKTPPRSYSDDLGIILLLDTSGSMQGQPMSDVKRAAIGIVQKLVGRSLGIIIFSSYYSILFPLGTIPADTSGLERMIDGVYPRGGTRFTDPLIGAWKMFQNSQFSKKQVILLSDGSPSDYNQLTYFFNSFQNSKMSVSTIAFGRFANKGILQDLAARNNGKFYDSLDYDGLQKDLEKELERISGPAYRLGKFEIKVASPKEPLLDGLPSDWPELEGYVGTVARKGTLVPLKVEGNPLLAYAPYGLGKSMVWTSDMYSWGAGMQRWSGSPTFMGSIVRNLLNIESFRYSASTRLEGEQVVFELRAFDSDGYPLSGLPLQVEARYPDSIPSIITPKEVELGKYQVRVALKSRDSLVFEAFELDGDQNRLKRAGFDSFVYLQQDERIHKTPDETLLRSIARDSGGKYNGGLELPEVKKELNKNDLKGLCTQPFFLFFGFLLFCLELGLRRLRLLEKALEVKGIEKGHQFYEQLARQLQRDADVMRLKGDSEGAEKAILKSRQLMKKARSEAENSKGWESFQNRLKS